MQYINLNNEFVKFHTICTICTYMIGQMTESATKKKQQQVCNCYKFQENIFANSNFKQLKLVIALPKISRVQKHSHNKELMEKVAEKFYYISE